VLHIAFENLGELIGKTEDGKYKLSGFGEAANATMTKVEDIPSSAGHQSSETTLKRVVRRSVAIALAMICIVLVAGIGGAILYYASVVSDKDKTISSQNSQISGLGNQKSQLQTWLIGNETLLNQTQANNTNLQKEIDSLNSNVANLQNEVTNLHIAYTNNSTIWVNNVTTMMRFDDSERSEQVDAVVWWGYPSAAGFVSVQVSSNSSSTFVDWEIFNTTNMNITRQYPGLPRPSSIIVGFGGTVVFAVPPSSTVWVFVGSIREAGEAEITTIRVTDTITYYY